MLNDQRACQKGCSCSLSKRMLWNVRKYFSYLLTGVHKGFHIDRNFLHLVQMMICVFRQICLQQRFFGVKVPKKNRFGNR